MPKRDSKKVGKVAKSAASPDRLAAALGSRTKAELIEALVGLARDDRKIMRRLESWFEIQPPPKELIAATRQAIADATDFDERQINCNFDYDSEAYLAVKRNLGNLIEMGHLRAAMELALELMSKESYQVEMSDEGMMTDDIEECLEVVVESLKNCDLPANEVVAWCSEMRKKDRIGCIYDTELAALQRSVEGTAE